MNEKSKELTVQKETKLVFTIKHYIWETQF